MFYHRHTANLCPTYLSLPKSQYSKTHGLIYLQWWWHGLKLFLTNWASEYRSPSYIWIWCSCPPSPLNVTWLAYKKAGVEPAPACKNHKTHVICTAGPSQPHPLYDFIIKTVHTKPPSSGTNSLIWRTHCFPKCRQDFVVSNSFTVEIIAHVPQEVLHFWLKIANKTLACYTTKHWKTGGGNSCLTTCLERVLTCAFPKFAGDLFVLQQQASQIPARILQ